MSTFDSSSALSPRSDSTDGMSAASSTRPRGCTAPLSAVPQMQAAATSRHVAWSEMFEQMLPKSGDTSGLRRHACVRHTQSAQWTGLYPWRVLHFLPRRQTARVQFEPTHCAAAQSGEGWAHVVQTQCPSGFPAPTENTASPRQTPLGFLRDVDAAEGVANSRSSGQQQKQRNLPP